MTDRELLEMAAKAAGYALKWGETYIVGDDEVDCTDLSYVVSGQPDEADWLWSPLEDDGDALRLAVKLGIDLCVYSDRGGKTYANTRHLLGYGSDGLASWQCHQYFSEEHAADAYAATRRAIVRAAAEIGRSMP